MNIHHPVEKGEEPVPDLRLQLSVESTRLAMERTQLAWVRTVLTFITAGLAIDRGTALLHEARMEAGLAWSKTGHLAGLLLTGMATILMIWVAISYIRRIGQLNRRWGNKNSWISPGSLLSIFLCVIGVLVVYFLSVT